MSLNTILFIETAEHLSVKDMCLVVSKENKEMISLYINDIQAIIIENVCSSISIPALLLVLRHNIPIIICNEQHQAEVYFLDLYRHTELLRCLQMQISWKESQKEKAWREIIKIKISNQLKILEHFFCTPQTITKLQNFVLEIDFCQQQYLNVIESNSAKLYFQALFGKNFRRFSEQQLNSALNYGYAVVRSQILSILVAKGLHPALGIWHHSIRNRFNLADDIIEVLRPFVDMYVKNLILIETFSVEHRKELIEILSDNLIYNGQVYSLKQSLTLFIENILHFLSGQTTSISLLTFEVK